jgi:hypothetical protein
MPQEDKVKENRLRRIAERRGMRLEKSRRRDPKAPDFEGFMLIDARKNYVIVGGEPFAYSASLEDVEKWLDDQAAPSERIKLPDPYMEQLRQQIASLNEMLEPLESGKMHIGGRRSGEAWLDGTQTWIEHLKRTKKMYQDILDRAASLGSTNGGQPGGG